MPAKVFISYSKERLVELTRDVASLLESAGYAAWWDTSLTPGEVFREVINRELDDADAVVVIWTPESVRSKWVVAEAGHADRRGVLITLRTKELDLRLIPKPYVEYQTDLVDNRDAILSAVRRIVGPAPSAPAQQDGNQSSEQVERRETERERQSHADKTFQKLDKQPTERPFEIVSAAKNRQTTRSSAIGAAVLLTMILSGIAVFILMRMNSQIAPEQIVTNELSDNMRKLVARSIYNIFVPCGKDDRRGQMYIILPLGFALTSAALFEGCQTSRASTFVTVVVEIINIDFASGVALVRKRDNTAPPLKIKFDIPEEGDNLTVLGYEKFTDGVVASRIVINRGEVNKKFIFVPMLESVFLGSPV
jgi:hypothetical protein